MEKISTILEKITNILLVSFISLLTVSTLLQVFSRFIFKSPFLWTEEASRMSFIWIALLGASLATKHCEHLAIDIITSKLGGTTKKVLGLIIHVIMIVVALVLIIGGWVFVEKNMGRVSVTIGIPMYYLYISSPVSGGLMLFYLIEQIPNLLKNQRMIGEDLS